MTRVVIDTDALRKWAEKGPCIDPVPLVAPRNDRSHVFDAWCPWCGVEAHTHAAHLLDELDALRAENHALREALAPFAEMAERVDRFTAVVPDEWLLSVTGLHLSEGRACVGDLRRSAQTIKENPNE